MLFANEPDTAGWPVLAVINGVLAAAATGYGLWQALKSKQAESTRKQVEFDAAEERRRKDFEFTRYQRVIKLMEGQVDRIRAEHTDDNEKLANIEREHIRCREDNARLEERLKEQERRIKELEDRSKHAE